MKICRFSHDGVVSLGRLEGDQIRICKGDMLGRLDATGETVPLRSVKLLAPLIPGKIVAVGRNYVEHAQEMGHATIDEEPLLFMKPPSSVIAPEESIVRPSISQRVDYEGELGVVIGRRTRNLSDSEDPLASVFGYTCVNDVTARDLQKKDVQFTRAKGFDTFCPFGPWIETELDPTGLNIETRVNGKVRQQGNTRQMIFPIRHLIRFVASIMTLLPGDLLTTGTPAGVGPLASGDVVEVEVEGIGVLRNPVV